MGKRIKIPASIEAAQDRLAALDGIATATGWERAAIVYALTREGRPGEGGPGRATVGNPTVALTISAFAGLKIIGLRTKETVIHYRNCWKDAMQAGDAVEVHPGDTVSLPTSPFPPANRGSDGYDSEEGAERTIERIKAKHGPEIIAKQATDPKVAKAVASNKKAVKAVGQQQAARTQEIVKARKKAATANPTAAGQVAEAVDAAAAANRNDNSPGYNAINSGKVQMTNAWLKAIKEQSFTPFDRHLLGSDLPSLRRLVDEITAFVEADDDPYVAVNQLIAEREEEMQRDLDAADAEADIDAGLVEAERFANEAS